MLFKQMFKVNGSEWNIPSEVWSSCLRGVIFERSYNGLKPGSRNAALPSTQGMEQDVRGWQETLWGLWARIALPFRRSELTLALQADVADYRWAPNQWEIHPAPGEVPEEEGGIRGAASADSELTHKAGPGLMMPLRITCRYGLKMSLSMSKWYLRLHKIARRLSSKKKPQNKNRERPSSYWIND